MSKLDVLFIAIISGIITRLGLPGIGNLILQFWDSLSNYMFFMLASDLHIYISIIGIIVFLIASYFIFEPLIKGLMFGLEGIIIVIIGFGIGFLVTGYIIGFFNG